MPYRSPTGKLIVGIVENIVGIANVDPNDLEYLGETEVDWDSQMPQRDAQGNRIFIDEAGDEWPENKLENKP